MGKNLAIVLNVVRFTITILYPFAMYGIVKYYPDYIWLIAIAILLLLAWRFMLHRVLVNSMFWQLVIVGSFCCALYLYGGCKTFIKAYPIIVSLNFLWGFAVTLFPHQVPIIEKFASLRVAKEKQTERFKSYCRKVTIAWCCFFVVNITLTLLASYISLELWTIYTGILSYVLIGLMFTGEYCIRRLVMHI